MNLIKWQPSRNILNDFDLMIDNIFNDGWNLHTVPRNNTHPAIDIKESENEYMIIADLPGFDKSNINLSFLLFRKPGEKGGCAFNILTIPRPGLDNGLFRQGNARHFQ